MRSSFLSAGCGASLLSAVLAAANVLTRDAVPCSAAGQMILNDCLPADAGTLANQNGHGDVIGRNNSISEEAFAALAILQNTYFEPEKGTWPASIDWTGAVVQTIVSGMLNSMSKRLESEERSHTWAQKEKLISTIFAQVTHSFFGQNAVGILDEAYDDILWVVLGWLEAMKLVRLHSTTHYPESEQECLKVPTSLSAALSSASWHGNRWVCTFAQRARAFWDFATDGWDTSLCNGGMIWNPKLIPYKNAITNELWIAASISMYQFFPGDKFNDTWVSIKGFPTNDPVYLAAAAQGYKWLKDVNMTNSQGLFFDGYHVDMKKAGNTKCDQPDTMVYTYNQGVILTGQRGLFAVTGSPSYLDDGHGLIRSVINATGWDLRRNRPIDGIYKLGKGRLPPWRGLGRYGILEEQCDATGTCSQDAQTFKGIFFHHLTAFCAPIASSDVSPDAMRHITDFRATQDAHDEKCDAYVGWLKHNVDAALQSRDALGRFGMWWGAGIFVNVTSMSIDSDSRQSPNVTDYRNKGTPRDSTWSLNATWEPGQRYTKAPCHDLSLAPDPNKRRGVSAGAGFGPQVFLDVPHKRAGDPNDRGRGRTVETQAGGLALLRAYWEVSQRQGITW